MSQSLSWIDPEALAASLARAGVKSRPRMPTAARSPETVTGPTAASGLPAVYHQVQIPGHLQEMMGAEGASTQAPAPAPAPGPARPAAPASAPDPVPPPTAPAGHKIVTPARLSIPEPTTVEAAKASAAAARAGAAHQDAAHQDDDEIEAFEPPASRLHDRLEAFMEWVERQVHCHEMFIVDEEGLVLMERNSDPTLIAVSSYFLNFNERIRSSLGAQSEGSVSIDLKGGQTLHVVQAETRLGPHALGFTISQPLRRKVTESFRASLPIVFGQEPS